MTISSAISLALSGLALTQRETDLVAQNVARSSQAGYTRKELTISDYLGNTGMIGIRGIVQRTIDLELQRQVTQATPSTAFTAVQAGFANRIDQLMGTPGETDSLSAAFTEFNDALQALSASPDSLTARITAVNQASTLTERLNQLSSDMQSMRTEAEAGLADGVQRVNELLKNVETLNGKIVAQKAAGQDVTALEDARDQSVKELASFMDVQTREISTGALTVYTRAGLSLVDSSAVTLRFDQQGTLTADALWSADPSERGVGTITVTTNGENNVDLVKDGLIRSGKLAAYLQVRDELLVKAQNQLDALAASLADAMSGSTVQGSAAVSGAQEGFDVDLADLKSGNVVSLTYVDATTGKTEKVSFVRVDDPATLPLGDDATPATDDRVVGIDFSGGMAAVATQMQAALGTRFTVSNPAGDTIEILDDGAPNTIDITGLSAHVTLADVENGELGFPLFTDGTGGALFTNSLDGSPQKRGFAGRISVNPAILDDPALLVQWQAATEPGDPARANELITRLNDTQFVFGADTGLVSGNSTYRATLEGFANTVVSYWGMISEDATSAKDTQDLVQTNLEARFNETASVNVDQELARLIQLQTAYAANARVMTVAQEMLNTLMQV